MSGHLEAEHREKHRQAVKEQALSSAAHFERELSGALSALHTLSMTIQQNGDIDRFDFVAAELANRYPELDALALLPNGKVVYTHPEGNDVFALNTNARESADFASAVQRAEVTEAVVLDASTRDDEGRPLLVAWLPVVTIADNKRAVWGHASASIRLAELVRSSGLEHLTRAGYHYRLIDTSRGQDAVLHTALPGKPIDTPVVEMIRVPDGGWMLEVAPMEGWVNHRRTAGYLLVGLGFAFALTLLFHAIRLRTEQRRVAEEALIESELRHALALEGANDGMWDWNLQSGEMFYSARWKTMMGCGGSESLRDVSAWMDRIHPDDRGPVQDAIAAHVAGDVPHFESDYRIRHSSGDYRWMKSRGMAVRDDTGTAVRMAGSQSDITQQKRVEEQLLHDTLHDGLTGLPNRALLMNRLEHVILASKRKGRPPFAVLFLDLDRFKVINDSLGHHVGDGLLIGIARRVQDCLRPADTMARLGGDEFAILLPEIIAPDDASTVADRVQAVLEAPFEVDGHEIFASTSIGIATGDEDARGAMEFLRDADTAMYHAKAGGRSQHVVFNGEMHAAATRRHQMENDLRNAISRRQLELHYQPVLRVPNRELVGFEALVRWNHPVMGRVSPMDFIPIAEETGLILPIGEWVLNEACRQLRRWRRSAPHLANLTMAVNLSGKQLQQPGLAELVKRSLLHARLMPEALILEITESVIMEQVGTVTETLHALGELGIELHIDDFGTGYSSLAYLTRFPVHALKIDRSFVMRLCENQDSTQHNARVARAITTLAHDLGMKVVAEGVERDAQLKRLQLMGVDHAQGYLFAKPMPALDVERLLERADGLEIRPAAG